MRALRWGIVTTLALMAVLGGWWQGGRPGWSGGEVPRLAYIYRGDLHVVSPGSRPVRLTRGASALRPRWSGDGRWVAYLSGDQLWIASADGRMVQRVGDRDARVSHFAWSPGTSLLAYTALGRLWVVPVGPSGAGAAREVHLPAGEFAWSPDGTRLVVAEPAGGPWPAARMPPDHRPISGGVAVVPAEGGAFTDLFRIPRETRPYAPQAGPQPVYHVKNLAWSPDGKWITFHKLPPSGSLAADSTTLAVVAVTGGQIRDVGTMLGYGEWVRWRPDAQALGYIAGPGRQAWEAKALHLAYPPEFRAGGKWGPLQVTPPKQVDRGFAWLPACAGRRDGAPFGVPLATVRSGLTSPRDQYDRPLPAIFVDQRQVTSPEPPFGDDAPHWDCRGRLYWVRISYPDAAVMSQDGKLAPLDVPDWYYGHWFTDQVLDWWEPQRQAFPEDSRVTVTIAMGEGGGLAYSPAHVQVKPGDRVRLTLINKAREQSHRFVLPEFGVRSRLIPPGGTARLSFVASRPGRYRYFCDLPGHKESGMVGVLEVEAR